MNQMKLKRLFSAIGLGLFAVASVSAGVLAFAKGPRMEKVKADGNTWMFSVTLKAANLEEAYDVSNIRIHTWGNKDTTVALHPSGQEHVYTVNLPFGDDDYVTGCQFIFYQTDSGNPSNSGDKHSINLNVNAEGKDQLSKTENNGISFSWVGKTDWDDGHWIADSRSYCYPKLGYQADIHSAEVPYDFEIDAANARYIYRNVTIVKRYQDMLVFHFPSADNSIHSFEMLDKIGVSNTEGTSGSSNWTYLNSDGTFDVIIGNSFDGTGIISIKKQEAADDTWLYYVTESASATTDYIYSWGGSEQFGAFPGTSIADLVAADKAEEMTGNGVVHFQGGETAKLIYKINISKGYPTGDLMFMFNNGTSSFKSAERLIQNEHAYWWTGEANHDAAQAINFIEILESRRNAVADTSICNIIEANATVIINAYNAFDESIRETYIDCTTIYTWANKEKSGNTLVTVRAIVEQLAEMYNKPLAGTSSTVSFGFQNNTTLLVTMISVITVVSAAGVVALVIIRKKKHQ